MVQRFRALLQAMRPRCSRGLMWGIIFCIIVCRIACLLLSTVWLCDCFFREYKMGIQCKDFSLYSHPEVISAIWLTIVSFTSFLLMFYVRRLAEFPGFKAIASHLLHKKYFYQLCVTLVLVLIYDLITIFGGEIQVKRTVVYTTFMLEHITSVALMFTLNFVPKFVKNTDSQCKSKTVVYKMTLLVYSIENYVVYALGTIVAAYKLVAIPTCSLEEVEIKYNITRLSTSEVGNTECHDATAVSMLLLLLVALSLRHTLGEFFLTKIFTENADNLDTPSQPNPLEETRNISTEDTPLLSQRS